MILAIDIGNTNVVFGLFKGKKLVREWRFPTAKYKIPKIKHKIEAVIVASVVPRITEKLKLKIKSMYGCRPFIVTAENIQGLKVKLKNKREIGADRVVDALAAYRLYGGPVIIVDFGTATTFDVVSAKGEYIGGAIAPGIDLARNALHEQTAKLPRIKISAPKNVIGKDTVSAMRSGLVYGYVAMVEGMIARLKDGEMVRKAKVIATGGRAKLICKYTSVVDRIDEKLTLKGLRIIADDLEV